MNPRSLLIALYLAFSCMSYAAERQHTPAVGSAERKSICDGARAFVLQHYTSSKKLPQPLLFKIERIEVLGNYCSFQAIPVFKDGSPVGTDYVMDIVFDFCVKKTDDSWSVIYDFSRTDVPSDAELLKMWRAFPKDFPFSLIPKFWRDHFERLR